MRYLCPARPPALQQTVAMLMQPEASTHTTHDDPEPNLDGVPLLESQPIDFSRAGGGLPVPVDVETEGEGGADLDGEPLEVCIIYYIVEVYSD